MLILDRALTDLALFTVSAQKGPSSRHALAQTTCQIELSAASALEAEFKYQSFGDQINLWYVAVTRPRHTLRISPKLVLLLEVLIRLHHMMQHRNVGDEVMPELCAGCGLEVPRCQLYHDCNDGCTYCQTCWKAHYDTPYTD